jgi:hypothetical protein
MTRVLSRTRFELYNFPKQKVVNQNNSIMSETIYQVGDKVTILDVRKEGELISVSEDGLTFGVKYTDDAGTEQVEPCTADKLVKALGRIQRRRGRLQCTRLGYGPDATSRLADPDAHRFRQTLRKTQYGREGS